MIIWFSIILKPLGNDENSSERLRTENDILNAGSRRPLGFRAHRLHQNVVSWKRPLGRRTSTWRAELWHSANRGHFPPFRHLRARATTRYLGQPPDFSTDSTKFGPDPRFTPTSRDLPATPRSLRGRSEGDPNRANSVIKSIL